MRLKKRLFINSFIFLMSTFLLIAFGSFSSVQADFSTDVLVNDDGTTYDQILYDYGLHSVAIHGSDVYATWLDGRVDGILTDSDVYFAKGTIDANGNISFLPNVKVNDVNQSAGIGHTSPPTITVASDGTIFIVWKDTRNGEDDIYLARSTDGGNTFSANQKIDNLPSTEAYTHRRSPKVVAADGYVYVIFGKGLASSLEMSISSDNGVTFSTPSEISQFAADDTVIAADGAYVYIARPDNNKIMLSISSDHGQSFGTPFEVSDDMTGATKDTVSIAASGNNLYLVWRDRRDAVAGLAGGDSIYCAVSNNRGTSFASNIKIAPDAGNTADRNSPCVAADGNNVAVTYDGELNNNESIIAKLSFDAGVTWTDEQMVSDSFSRPSIGPASVAINSSAAAVIWTADGQWVGSQNTGQNIYSAVYVFNNANPSNCPDGISSFDSATSVLTLHSLCLDGYYYNNDIKILLDFNNMTFKIIP